MLLFKLFYLYIFNLTLTVQIQHKKIFAHHKQNILALGPKINKLRKVEICYDSVGCFEIKNHHNPLQRFPQHPELLLTRFLLFRRDINFTQPEILTYNELKSIENTRFDTKDDLKVIIHGFMSKWNEQGALAGVQAYLDIESYNIIVVDWEIGAQGPNYAFAAANTELIGRQLGILLLQLASIGTEPSKMHLIGFSLGAHVAACASEILKENGIKIGRITGLDPASPLFKLNNLRDNRKKLDISDADFVDVIHTDGSPVFTDGFGLLQPLGHVDFFPNGGREQPGCNDIRNSVVKSHFDKSLDRTVACSHIRAYEYFLETLQQMSSTAKGFNHSRCHFMAYSCPGGPRDYALGRCFPVNTIFQENGAIGRVHGELGELARGQGVMYLTTRSQPPFCGMQLQIIIHVSGRTRRTKGLLAVNLRYLMDSANFYIFTDLMDTPNQGRKIFGLSAANFETMNENIQNMTLNILFTRQNNPNKNAIFIDKVQIIAMNGRSWQISKNFIVQPNRMATITLFAL